MAPLRGYRYGTYQSEEDNPRVEHEASKYQRDGLGGKLLVGTEGMVYFGEGVERSLVWVDWGGVRGGNVEVEKAEFERGVGRGSDNESYLEGRGRSRWERRGRFGEILWSRDVFNGTCDSLRDR